MATALIDGKVMTPRGLEEGLAVVIDDGRISFVAPAREAPAAARRVSLEGGLLLPGFIDTQVNGGGGVLFNDEPTAEAIARIGAAHRRFGTTGFLPTLISDDMATVKTAMAAAGRAIAAGAPGVLGVHVEGPFLNSERKGIHEAEKIRPLDEEGLEALASLALGKTVVTLAPELAPRGAVATLTRAGVIVCAGHTSATYGAVMAAMDEGLTGFTHLFNAMPPLSGREPGVVGAALSDPRAFCGLIVDGRHVDPVVLRLALKCQPLERFFLVTDAMPCVGGERSSFLLQGKRIRVRDGACFDARGRLAGSNLDMAAAVRNAVAMLDIDLAAASRMASAHPARFLGLERETGAIAPGLRADLVLLDEALDVRETWIAGQPSAGPQG